MPTYQELKAQMAELQAQTEAARQAELQVALEEIRAKVVEDGITEQDIFGSRRGARVLRSRGSAPAKYRDRGLRKPHARLSRAAMLPVAASIEALNANALVRRGCC